MSLDTMQNDIIRLIKENQILESELAKMRLSIESLHLVFMDVISYFKDCQCSIFNSSKRIELLEKQNSEFNDQIISQDKMIEQIYEFTNSHLKKEKK